MIRYALGIALLTTLVGLPVHAEPVAGDLEVAGDLYVIGEAYDQRDGLISYRELHFCTADALRCSIQYQNPDGKLIARKDLDYRNAPNAPEVSVHDIRMSQRQTITAQDEKGLVVDAGFDNFVRSQWDALLTGESVKFRFLVVGRSKPFTMRAQRDDSRSCSQDELCLTVALDSWLLGMLADPIDLTYSLTERRLKRFQGVSNIRSASGEALNVDIQYDYESESNEPASLGPVLIEPTSIRPAS